MSERGGNERDRERERERERGGEREGGRREAGLEMLRYVETKQ